jgi:hypothetical protein
MPSLPTATSFILKRRVRVTFHSPPEAMPFDNLKKIPKLETMKTN